MENLSNPHSGMWQALIPLTPGTRQLLTRHSHRAISPPKPSQGPIQTFLNIK